MKKLILAVGAMVALTGCSQMLGKFSKEEATIAVYNRSGDAQTLILDGIVRETVTPNGTANFQVEIQVSRNRVDNYASPSGPSQVDKVVMVTVAFRNERTKTLSDVSTCNAGAKATTHVLYTGSGRPDCTVTYPY